MLTYVGKLTAADETSILAMAKSLTQHGSLTTDQLLWTHWEFGWQAQGSLGADGHLYSKKGIGLPLLLWPLMQLSHHIPHLGSIPAALLLNPIVCTLIAVVVFAAAVRSGYPEKSAFLLATLGSVGTILWPYSKTIFSEPASALFLVAAVYFVSGRLTARNGFLGGWMLAWAILVKLTNAIVLPVFAGYLLYRYQGAYGWRQARALWGGVAALLALPTVGVVLIAALNHAHFGSWLSTGYGGGEAFTNPLASGLRELLFSPDEGIFIFSPLFILAVIGLPLSWRRARSQTALLMGVIATSLLLFAGWYDWRGGVAWGPRFLVPLTPFFQLLMLPLIHDWVFVRRGWRRATVIAIAAFSCSAQVAGVLAPYLEVGGPWPLLSAWGWLGRSPLSAWDVAWLQRPGRLDVTMLLLFGGLALLALILAGAWLRAGPRKSPGLAWLGLAALAVCLAGLIYGASRPYLDRRMSVGDDYSALLRRLAERAAPGDAVVIDHHARTDFFLSQDRSVARLHGFLRSDVLRPEAEKTLEALVRSAGQIWLISDRPAGAPVPKPEETWLNQHTFRVGEEAFSEYARLIHYYEPPVGALKDQRPAVAFGEKLWLAGYQLVEQPSWRAGEVLSLALDWELRQPLTGSVTSSVQLIRPDGVLVWQRDLPLSLAHAGDRTTVRYGIPLVRSAAGPHVLQLAIYDPVSRQREWVATPDNDQRPDRFILARPMIE